MLSSSLTLQVATSGTKVMRLKTALGMENLIKAIMVLIWDVSAFFNVGETKNMNETQVISTAQILIEDYPNFSLEDFALCFKNGKKGKYDKNYSAFDGQVLMRWVKAYDLERDECFVAENKPNDASKPILTGNDIYKNFDASKIFKDEEGEKEEEYRKVKAEYYKKNLNKPE